MVEDYPTRPTLANRLLSALGPLQEDSYPFADIRAAAQAYGIQLVRARDDGVWKEETEAAKEARKAKEQAAAAARQKKAVEQMEQMEQITRDQELEESKQKDSSDQRRQGRGAAGRDREEDRRGGNQPPVRDERENRLREDRWPRRDDSGRQGDDRWQRGGEISRTSAGNRGSKRSRGPSPADHEDSGRLESSGRPNKRQRNEVAEDGAVPDDSGTRRSRRGGRSTRR